jgi:tetratricopeptide (TPR) repeat protein
MDGRHLTAARRPGTESGLPPDSSAHPLPPVGEDGGRPSFGLGCMMVPSRWIPAAAVASALLVGVPAALATADVRTVWARVLAIVLATGAAVVAGVWLDRYKRLATHRDERAWSMTAGCLVYEHGGLPRVRDIADPRLLGVHAAPPAGTGDDDLLPAYVGRDVDEALRARVSSGGFVLLVGDSTAGKSRTAFEALLAVKGDYTIIVPSNAAALSAAVDRAAGLRRSVLWLDDIERYFGEQGLTREMLARVLLSGGDHRIVIGTMRAAEMARYIGDADSEIAPAVSRRVREVLDLAEPAFRLDRLLSDTERRRAQHEGDHRIADALEHCEYGLGEYLACAPGLLADWQNAWEPGGHPRGAALITAAVDCRRAGLVRPLPAALLEQTHVLYLDRRGGERLSPERLSGSWQWATRVRRSTASLLFGSATAGFDVFDYLVDVTQRAGTAEVHIPLAVISAALAYADANEAHSLGATAEDQGAYQLAEQAFRRSYDMQTQALGAEHHHTLDSRNSLAITLRSLGRLDEADVEQCAVLDACVRIFGPEHPYTLASRSNFALVLQASGRLAEAEVELRNEYEASTRVLGAEHPSTLTSRDNLAALLHNLGRSAEAVAEHRAVMAIQASVFDGEHPNTLTSRHNLAIALRGSGCLTAAEVEFRAVVASRIRVLGAEHPDTLASRNNLAAALGSLGRFEEAEAEHRATLAIESEMLGAEHPSALASRDNLAIVLRDLMRFQEAELEFRAVVASRIRVLGAEHPDTLTSRNNLAAVLGSLGRFEEAQAECHGVLESRIRVSGAEHPHTLVSRSNLLAMQCNLGRLAGAEAECRSILDIQDRVLGAEHPSTLLSRASLAAVLRDLGRLEEAEVEFRAVLVSRARVLGAEHPDTLSSRSCLATVAHRLGRLDEAAAEFRAVLEASARVLGTEHPHTLISRQNLAANVMCRLRRWDKAPWRSRESNDPLVSIAADDA